MVSSPVMMVPGLPLQTLRQIVKVEGVTLQYMV